MKILVTGFQPFGGERINPSFEVVKGLSSNISGAEIIKWELPTVFVKSSQAVIEIMEKEKPDIVLSIGQAGGRSSICVERIAINIDDARIPDNENQQPIDLPINPQGPAAYFSSLPIKAMVNEINSQGIAAMVSDSAGTFVCNHLMYGVLNHINLNGLNIKSGFIHIPYLPEQVIDKPNTPSMSLENLVMAIESAIIAIIRD